MPSSAELIIRAKRIYLFTENELRYLLAIGPDSTRQSISNEIGIKIAGIAGIQDSLTSRRQMVEEQVYALGQWLQYGACPEPAEDVQEFRCHNRTIAKAKVCRSTKPITEFPFYPVDTRCEACIASAIAEEKEKYANYTRRKTDKAQKLETAMLEKPPTPKQMAALIAENLGGWTQVAEMYANLAKTGTAVQRKQLLEWMLKFTEEDDSNLNINIDGMTPAQVDKVIVDAALREFHRRKDNSDVAELLRKQYGVEPPENLGILVDENVDSKAIDEMARRFDAKRTREAAG